MAQMTIQIPDAQVNRVINALCSGLFAPTVGTAVLTPIDPTPALAKQVVIEYIKERVVAYEREQAVKAIPPVDVQNVVG